MSSVDSPRTSPLAERRDALCQAFADVGERSFFAYFECCDDSRFAESVAVNTPWIRSSVSFEGAFDGAVCLTVPDALARELFGAFLGAEPGLEVPDSALFDLVGELTNMVCGTWLTRACPGRFELRHPKVLRLSPNILHPDAPDCLLFLINDQPAYLRLVCAER
jgi:hypothetical protein